MFHDYMPYNYTSHLKFCDEYEECEEYDVVLNLKELKYQINLKPQEFKTEIKKDSP